MKPKTRAEQQYVHACAVARSGAASAPIEELRRGNADRIAKSYGIRPDDATRIIINAYRERAANG